MGKRQGEIPGTERPGYDEVVAGKAEKYIAARDERMELTKKEVDAKKDLRDVMAERKITQYEDDDVTVDLETEVVEKLKAKRRSSAIADIEVE